MGDRLGKEQATHYAQAQGAAGFTSVSLAHGDRQRAEERAPQPRHDRAGTDWATWVDGFVRRLAFIPLGFQREVDLHGGVLLYNPDQEATKRSVAVRVCG